jgi:LysR family glycine cleavage system transcriptional activator
VIGNGPADFSTCTVDLETTQTDFDIRYGMRRLQPPGTMVVPLPPETIVPLCAPALINGDHPIRKTRDLAFHTLIHGEVCLVGWRELIRRHRTVKLDISRGLLFDRSFMAISAAVDGLDVCL